MAGLLARSREGWQVIFRELEVGVSLAERNSMLSATLPLNRAFAALGRGGRPRTEGAAQPARAATAAVSAEDKKPASAYALFVKETFPKLQQSSPQPSFGTISKELSAQWKGMSESDKKKYAQQLPVTACCCCRHYRIAFPDGS